jgi:glycosyltransferase involved in cell wall biosynthesis
VPGGNLRLLYLGRLHPIKGIENLFKAIKLLDDDNITLTICGNGDENYSMRLQELAHELALERCVSFKGHVEGVNKLEAFRHADVCILPSFSENFGMVVAESLAHGIPVIASQGTPWQDVEKHGCGLWVENQPEALANSIRRVRKMDLPMMGRTGRHWMNASFGWGAIGSRVFDVYEGLLARQS